MALFEIDLRYFNSKNTLFLHFRSLPLNDVPPSRGGHERTPTERHRGFPERERDGPRDRDHRRERDRDRDNFDFDSKFDKKIIIAN